MDEFQRRFLPSHFLLRSFDAAARLESFTLAAKELNLTQSAISRQVKELEQIVGVDLFRRVGRRVILTRAGQKFAGDLAIDLGNLQRTVMRAISAGDMNSSLRVATLPTFACRWLVPRLSGFNKTHPNVEISLSTRLKPFDLEEEHFDLAIHFGQQNWPNTDMLLLCSEVMIPVASPDFVRTHGISSLEDLARAPLLHLSTRPTVWLDYFQSVRIKGSDFLKGKYFDQFSMIIAGAEASLAAALVPRYLVERELRTGALQVLADETFTTNSSYFLVTPANQNNQLAAEFCAWMIGQVGLPSI
ncbi:MAG: LysR family transcriptional regulator [Hyphomicrobiales bacterium]|nr:LysR family transcriptional regulator [Hyphomicrobiales bacterium]